VEAKPAGFDKPSFIGLLSLELKGSQGRNLAGFMTVQNDLPDLGKMQFYQVPLDSKTKLLGPSAVREALAKDPDFAQLQTLLRNPRIGDNILYRIGNDDVYFIPIYTAGSAGVVTQLGTIAAVGAAFDLENTKNLISTFLKNFVQPRTDKIIFWEENNTVKLGTIVVVDNVPELHYISIEVG